MTADKLNELLEKIIASDGEVERILRDEINEKKDEILENAILNSQKICNILVDELRYIANESDQESYNACLAYGAFLKNEQEGYWIGQGPSLADIQVIHYTRETTVDKEGHDSELHNFAGQRFSLPALEKYLKELGIEFRSSGKIYGKKNPSPYLDAVEGYFEIREQFDRKKYLDQKNAAGIVRDY